VFDRLFFQFLHSEKAEKVESVLAPCSKGGYYHDAPRLAKTGEKAWRIAVGANQKIGYYRERLTHFPIFINFPPPQ
jgi:hypothetical protein